MLRCGKRGRRRRLGQAALALATVCSVGVVRNAATRPVEEAIAPARRQLGNATSDDDIVTIGGARVPPKPLFTMKQNRQGACVL